MKKVEKIALLTDSGNDVNASLSPHLFVVPLILQMGSETHFDDDKLTLDHIFNVIDHQKITTSLPTAETILNALDTIKSQGYTHLIVTTISSGLSGTFNFMRLLLEDYEGLEIKLIDTKNISIASGFSVQLALELIEAGKPFDEIIHIVESHLNEHKVFFTVGSLEYLRRGGRIGLVAGAVADLLSIKPVITCNETGVYHAVSKTRGYARAIDKMVELAQDFIKEAKRYDLTILVAKVDARTKEIVAAIKETFKKAMNIEIKSVSPVLAIHTGPQALGLALRRKDYAF